MIKLQTLGLAAAIGFAGAVLAQTPSPSTTTSTESQTSPSTSSSEEQDTMGQTPGTTESSTTQSPTGTPPISDSDTSGTAQVPTTAEEDPASAESESTRMAAASDMSKHDKHRVSKLIGKNVETSTGDTIGEVKDVVIDDQAKITHFIISHGRLGSTKLAAVPYQTVKQMMRGEKIVFEKTRLENAPSFEESNFPNLTSATWSSAADRYWGRARTASAESEIGSSSDTSGSMSSSETETETETESSSSEEETVPETSQQPPPY